MTLPPRPEGMPELAPHLDRNGFVVRIVPKGETRVLTRPEADYIVSLVNNAPAIEAKLCELSGLVQLADSNIEVLNDELSALREATAGQRAVIQTLREYLVAAQENYTAVETEARELREARREPEARLDRLHETNLKQSDEIYRARSALLHRCLGFAPDCKALDAGQLAERTVALVDKLRALVRAIVDARNETVLYEAIEKARAAIGDERKGTTDGNQKQSG